MGGSTRNPELGRSQWAITRLADIPPHLPLHVHERIDPRSIIEAVRQKNGSDYFQLAHETEGVDSGFRYQTVPYVTLKSIANNEAAEPETLYDQPLVDNSKARVTGPFTVEAVPAPMVKSLDDVAGEGMFGRADLPVGQDARQRVPTIMLEHWLRAHVDFDSLLIFADQQEIPRRDLARLSNVGGEMVASHELRGKESAAPGHG